MPKPNATVESAEASLANHPAVRAWRKLKCAEPAAADLAQFAWNALTPILLWSVAQVCWPRLHLSDFRRLGDLGRVFRWINALAWANWGFHERAVECYIAKMRFYEPEVAEWAQEQSPYLSWNETVVGRSTQSGPT
jgi:hypothetical protein